jgi:large subunit ribosomal protein L25
MDLQLAVATRRALGKENRRLRREGLVPGVVFGKGLESVPVQVDAKTFETLYRSAGRTSILQLTVEGDGGGAKSTIIKEVQRHPLTGRPLHVDFFVVDLTHEMEVEVPLVFRGRAPAIEETGGTLITPISRVTVKALPSDIPHEITVDVSPLIDLEAAIHVRDLVVDTSKVEIIEHDPDDVVAKVLPPRIEEEPAPIPAEEAEAEEAAAAASVEETEEEGGPEPGADQEAAQASRER